MTVRRLRDWWRGLPKAELLSDFLILAGLVAVGYFVHLRAGDWIYAYGGVVAVGYGWLLGARAIPRRGGGASS